MLLRSAKSIAACALPALAVWAVDASPQSSIQYDVFLNGETFTVSEGDTTTVQSAKDPAKSYTLSVRPKKLQIYQTDRHIFEYPASFNIADNFANPGRSIKLTHPDGITIVLTQLSRFEDNFRLDEAAGMIVEQLAAAFRARNPSGVRVANPSLVEFGNVQGSLSEIRLLDTDGSEQFCDVYVLNDGRYLLSVVAQYVDRGKKSVVAGYVKPLLTSVRPAPLPEVDSIDHSGHDHE